MGIKEKIPAEKSKSNAKHINGSTFISFSLNTSIILLRNKRTVNVPQIIHAKINRLMNNIVIISFDGEKLIIPFPVENQSLAINI